MALVSSLSPPSRPRLLECGGKRSATPLCAERGALNVLAVSTGLRASGGQRFPMAGYVAERTGEASGWLKFQHGLPLRSERCRRRPRASLPPHSRRFSPRDGSRFNRRALSHPGILECGGKRSATPLCAERLASAVHPALTGPKPACSQAFTTPHATDEARTPAGFSINSRGVTEARGNPRYPRW